MARWRTILVSSCIGLLGCGQFLIMVYPFFALAESSGAPANTFDLSIESMAIVILDANNLPSPAALEDRKTALSLEVEPRSESVRNFDYLAIIEIRDNNGVTTYLSWKQGHILDGAHQNITFSWTPASSGSYEARAFAIGGRHA